MSRGSSSFSLENEFLILRLKGVAGGWLTQEISAKKGSEGAETLTLVGEKPFLKGTYESVNCRDFDLILRGAHQQFSLLGEPLKRTEANGSRSILEFVGSSGTHTIKVRFTLEKGSKWLHARIEDQVKGSSTVEALGSHYSFVPDGKTKDEMLPLTFLWVPNLRPKENQVIGDHVFRSPAVIIQKSSILAALVPDLELLTTNRKMKTALDFELKSTHACGPTFGYGFKEYKPVAHVFYEHDASMTKTFNNDTLVYGYYILVDADANEKNGFGQVLGFLWRKYASKYTKEIEPQVLLFEEYARRAYNCMFNQYDIWREGEFEGKRIGGTIWQTWDGDPKEGRATDIKNQTWFNNLRVAYGMYHYGAKWGEKNLIEKARLMKNLALSAPSEKGIFASVLTVKRGALSWSRGTRAQDNVDFYHTADDAWTAFWMLQWRRDLESDNALVERAKALGDFFLDAQRPTGSIPSWVQIKDGKIEAVPPLEESATTACPAFFLVELYKHTGDRKYLDAAEKAAKFVEKEVIPENKWFDFEQYFTACGKKPGLRDDYTGLWGHNTLSLWWAIEMYGRLYEATDKREYLETGTRLLDILCLYQQVWNPPYLSYYAFGGFGVMNSDAEWSDAREAMFAPTLMQYSAFTGEDEYFERGVAALRASFTLMLVPEHRELARGNVLNMKEKDYGATYENYGHFGDDRKTPGYIMFDWGSGSAASAAAYVEKIFGDIYIDSKRNKGFGINGCIVDQVTLRDHKLVSVKIGKRIPRLREPKMVVK